MIGYIMEDERVADPMETILSEFIFLAKPLVKGKSIDVRRDTVIKLAGGLLFFLPFPYLVAVFSLLYTTLLYLVAVFSLLYITLHYWGHYSLLYSTCVRFMVAGGDLFVTPPLWHPASVAVRTLS